ncbi:MULTISPECIES: hypothetical protein [unclassified Pseudomonas]|uniref:hypothetical protein n=1 Tax=unclassified Pseudomonas TaxID=196821 RepID=UPI00244A1019|nr:MULTISPECIES: hypothetical protein [unclassified Pseudomonas]MDH0894217.1 hypothetical protein [Pseudomonas sp. GD03875]MDH1063488.1 hypothetical protein [Pseudomonas sp. GD03985]
MAMLSLRLGGSWRRAAPADRRQDALSWSATGRRDVRRGGGWSIAAPADRSITRAPWSAVPARDRASSLAWEIAQALGADLRSMPWGWVPACDLSAWAGWDRSIQPRDLVLSVIYNPKPARKDARVLAGHRRVNEFGPRYNAATALQDSLYIPGTGPLVFSFGGRAYFPPTSPAVYFDFRYEPERPRIQPTDMRPGAVRWQSARRLQRAAWLPWGRATPTDGELTELPYIDYPGPVKPLPEPPADPTILDTYMIANIVNVVVLPSRTPVEVQNLRLALDADSYSWSFSCDLFTRAALDLVRPGVDDGREIEVTINGYPWVFLVERYTRNRKFAREAYTITGATRTQLLGAPYAPPRTALNSAPITARQAAESELLNTGFTLLWDAENVGPPDWTFPAGTLSYQGQTAIQVIARIAETVGAIVRPAPAADELEVRPRYVAPPWAWGDVDTPISRVIPPVMMTDLSGEWTPQPAWNACYTSGTSHGVSMLVRRAGTAGDNPAPDVFDDWLTGQEANQQRGIHELSKGGNIEIVGFRLPLFHAADDHGVGLVLPGMLCRVPEESGPWVGLCLSVEISAEGTGASRVWQQLKLERHHSWPQ